MPLFKQTYHGARYLIPGVELLNTDEFGLFVIFNAGQLSDDCPPQSILTNELIYLVGQS